MADSRNRTLVDPDLSAGGESTVSRPLVDAAAPTASDTRPPAPEPPPDIPRYTIVRQIGHGGMGVVYEAIGPLGVRVALKVIHPHKVSPVLMARFRQEARAMMDLEHPNLARIFDYGEHAGLPYFTMKLLSGRTLADLLPKFVGDPAAGLRAILPVVDAAGYLHGQQKVHRDLKPSNVLLGDRDQPYVADLGLIKELADPDASPAVGAAEPPNSTPTPARGKSTTLTHTGAQVGTRGYMSPEQFAGDQSRIGPPADVYALGVILHEIGWGVRPGFANELLVFPEPGPADPVLATGLRGVVTRCLELQPQDRYPTAVDLGRELRALLDVPSPSAPSRRRVLWLAGVGAAGLATAGVARWAIGYWRGDPETLPPPDPLAEIRKELAENGSVELIGPDGQWRWHEWLAGEGVWQPDPTGGGRLGDPDRPAGPDGTRLFEIARGLDETGFRLVVEIAQLGPSGEVGAYVGRSLQQTKKGPVHCLLAVTLQEFQVTPDPKKGPRVHRRVQARACPVTNARGFQDAGPVAQRFDPGPPGTPVTMTLDLSATEFVVSVGGRELVRTNRNRFMPSARELGIDGGGGLTPTFHPSEGLGLFLNYSAMAVRTARLERFGGV